MSDTTTSGEHASKREVIVSAASRIFAEKGFSGTSNREVAREAGISPGLIYWYFRDKNELFLAVISRLFPLYGLTIPEDGAETLPLDEVLSQIGGQFISIMTGPNVLRLIRLALSEIIGFPEVWQKVGQMISQQAVGPLAEQFDQRIADGELAPIDSRMAAQAFFGSLVGYVLRKYVFRSVDLQDTDDHEYVSVVVRIYHAGLVYGAAPDGLPGDAGLTQ